MLTKPSTADRPVPYQGRVPAEGTLVRVRRCGSNTLLHTDRLGRVAATQPSLLGGGDTAVLVVLDDGAACYAAHVTPEFS
jgi:hypothetical protein